MELLYAVSWHIPKGESNVTLPAICVFLLFLLGNFPTYQQPVWVALLPIRTVIIYPLIPEFLRFVIRTCNEWTYTYYYCSDLSNISRAGGHLTALIDKGHLWITANFEAQHNLQSIWKSYESPFLSRCLEAERQFRIQFRFHLMSHGCGCWKNHRRSGTARVLRCALRPWLRTGFVQVGISAFGTCEGEPSQNPIHPAWLVDYKCHGRHLSRSSP